VTYDHTQLSGVALDLETGGLDPDTCALLRVGVVVVVHGRVAALCDWRVQPGGGLDLDPEALAVNRWEPRPNDSLEYEVLERLSGMVAGLPTDTQLLTFGHNVRWDLAVLRAVARRHGCSAPDLPHRLADSSVLALPLLLAGEVPSLRLDDLVPVVLGRPRSPDAHHSPLVDAGDALDVVQALLRRFDPARAPAPLDDAGRLAVLRHVAWCDEFVDRVTDHTGHDLGEHGSGEWREALDALRAVADPPGAPGSGGPPSVPWATGGPHTTRRTE